MPFMASRVASRLLRPCGVAPWQRASLAEPHGERATWPGDPLKSAPATMTFQQHVAGCIHHSISLMSLMRLTYIE